MSLRSEKMNSRVAEICAQSLIAHKQKDHILTIVSVDVKPHLRSGVVYISSLGLELDESKIKELRDVMQSEVAHNLTSKFVPRLSLKIV